VDVRVIAASNRELLGLVQRGLFRADLYARLAQWVVRLPALREHREDIPALTRSLLARLGEAGRAISPDLEEALLVHPWPLNVRGLSNVLCVATIASPAGQPLELGPEVLAALEDGRVGVNEPPQAPPPMALDKATLEQLLGRFHGRVAEVARHVGVSRPKLYRLLWAAELDPAQFRRP
jgi:DNA-binding NtrC family response regulator